MIVKPNRPARGAAALMQTLALLAPLPVLAADAVDTATAVANSWHAQSLPGALGHMMLFAGVGIVAAIVGYKVFDRCTPGDLHREIVEHKNIAAAIVAGSVILGICVIIAAAMVG